MEKKKARKKWIYRDKTTNRLLTSAEAKRRDEDTWIKEEFVVQPNLDNEPPPKA